jgi:hypothetical protein
VCWGGVGRRRCRVALVCVCVVFEAFLAVWRRQLLCVVLPRRGLYAKEQLISADTSAMDRCSRYRIRRRSCEPHALPLPTSSHSHGFCVMWVCISPSSIGVPPAPPAKLKQSCLKEEVLVNLLQQISEGLGSVSFLVDVGTVGRPAAAAVLLSLSGQRARFSS